MMVVVAVVVVVMVVMVIVAVIAAMAWPTAAGATWSLPAMGSSEAKH
jgi:hypothetical protein